MIPDLKTHHLLPFPVRGHLKWVHSSLSWVCSVAYIVQCSTMSHLGLFMKFAFQFSFPCVLGCVCVLSSLSHYDLFSDVWVYCCVLTFRSVQLKPSRSSKAWMSLFAGYLPQAICLTCPIGDLQLSPPGKTEKGSPSWAKRKGGRGNLQFRWR